MIKQTTELQPVTKNEYPELIQVWEASVRATHHFLSEVDIQYYKPLILEQYFDQLKLFCIKDKDRILGFVGIDQELIQMLFIDPSVRGMGLGKVLVNYAVESYNVSRVDVNEQNQQAVGFYEHLGFITTDRFDHDSAGKPYPVLNMTLKQKPLLRKATTDDIPAIIQLYTVTVLSVCANEYALDQLQAWADLGRNTSKWETRIKEQHFLLAETGQELQGFASISEQGYIDVFYVHKDHQGKGIAYMLYQALKQYAKDHSIKTLTADVSKSARLFFERQGFSVTRTNQNDLHGKILENYRMKKKIPAFPTR